MNLRFANKKKKFTKCSAPKIPILLLDIKETTAKKDFFMQETDLLSFEDSIENRDIIANIVCIVSLLVDAGIVDCKLLTPTAGCNGAMTTKNI